MSEPKKLKILFVTNNYTPYSGGVVSSIQSSAQALRTQGHQVWIITLDFLAAKHGYEDHVIRINCPIKFIHKKNLLAIPLHPDKEIETIVKKIKPDIIHVHHPFLLGISGLKAGKKYNIPVIFTYHTQYEKYAHYIPLPEPITVKITHKLVYSFCTKVDYIVAPSTSIATYLQESAIKTPIEIIPSGILPLFLSTPVPTGKVKGEKFRILTVSRFTKEKNIPFLLDVFAQLDQQKFTFDLIGYGAELPHLQDHAFNKLKLNPDQVRFIQHPPKNIIVNYYQKANLFIFASQTETQGLVLAESMAAGTPVVALGSPGPNDIILDAKNGFLVNNAEQMVEKINYLAEHPQELLHMQSAAWQTAQSYSPEKMAQKILNLYWRCVSDNF